MVIYSSIQFNSINFCSFLHWVFRHSSYSVCVCVIPFNHYNPSVHSMYLMCWTNERTNERMNERINEWMNEWANSSNYLLCLSPITTTTTTTTIEATNTITNSQCTSIDHQTNRAREKKKKIVQLNDYILNCLYNNYNPFILFIIYSFVIWLIRLN